MKKIITLIVALIIITTAAMAGNGNNINSVISKQLKVPTELKNGKLNEKVSVQFKIAENGKATVIHVETVSQELKKYIFNQFAKMNFNTVSENPEAIYFVDINFKVL